MVRDRVISRAQLSHALHVQKRQYRRERIGDILVGLGYVSRKTMREAVTRYEKRQLIGDVLVHSGAVTREQLREAFDLGKRRRLRLGELLLETGALDEETLARALAQHLDIPYVDPQPDLADMERFNRLPEHLMRSASALPVSAMGGAATVVVPDPTQPEIRDQLMQALGEDIDLAVGKRERIDSVIQALMVQRRFTEQAVHSQGVAEEQEAVPAKVAIDTKDIVRRDREGATTDLFDYLVWDAVRKHASDMHVEPQRDCLRVCYRVDGLLSRQPDLPLAAGGLLIRKAKVLAALDLGSGSSYQQGRIVAYVDDQEVDLLVAVSPSVLGQSMTIHIFAKDAALRDLDQLGMCPSVLSTFRGLARDSSWLVFFVGPKASGKTTSLYSTLNFLSDGSKKVVTLESPVEFALDGAVQGNVGGDRNPELASAMSSILYHDPDIIGLGDVAEDQEMRVLLRWAQMGYKVLATLHGDDSAVALTRLLSIDGADSVLAASPIVYLAQRLVRKVCPRCRQDYVPAPEMMEELRRRGFDWENVAFSRGKGCHECGGTGFSGRTGIFELRLVSPEMRDALRKAASRAQIAALLARDSSFVSLWEAGFLKVAQGVTTIEEVQRALSAVPIVASEGALLSFEALCTKAGVGPVESPGERRA